MLKKIAKQQNKIQDQTLYSNCHCSWIYKRNRFAKDSFEKYMCIIPIYCFSACISKWQAFHVYRNIGTYHYRRTEVWKWTKSWLYKARSLMNTFVLNLNPNLACFTLLSTIIRPLKSQNINVTYDTQGNVCFNTFHSILLLKENISGPKIYFKMCKWTTPTDLHK